MASTLHAQGGYLATGLGPTVTLHWKEVEHAELAAKHRNERARSKGVANAYGLNASEAENLQFHLRGAGGEMAVARVLGRYWECGESATDVAGIAGLEVRQMSQDHWGLRIRMADIRAKKICVAAIGVMPTFRIPGWIAAVDAERSEWEVDTHNGRPPFYSVPQSNLRPIEELRRLLALDDIT